MGDVSSDNPLTPSRIITAAFQQYLQSSPNRRRVSTAEQRELVEWLTGRHPPPSSQKEFSRRNYVRKTFVWDETRQAVMALAKSDTHKHREVVTEDRILGVVEDVHESIGHAGWDATWKAVSTSYYGIPRDDVIFLLKRCSVCALNPRKRPKRVVRAELISPCAKLGDDSISEFLPADDAEGATEAAADGISGLLREDDLFAGILDAPSAAGQGDR